MSSECSESGSPEYETSNFENEVILLRQEIERKNQLIEKYTKGFPEYENLHIKIRKEAEKRVSLETENEKLLNQIKILQNSRREIENQLKNEKNEHEKSMEAAQAKFLDDLKSRESEKEEIVEVLQKKIKECDLAPSVEDFIDKVSNICKQRFESLDEIAEFLSKHEEKYQNELEEMCNKCNEKISKLVEKLDVLRAKNRFLHERDGEIENMRMKMNERIKNYKAQIKRIDSNAQQQMLELEQDNERLCNVIKSLKENVKTLENSNARLRTQYAESEQRFDASNEKCLKMETQMRQLIQENSNDADKRIDEQKKEAKQYNNIIDRLSNELRVAKEEKQKVESEFREFEDKTRSKLDEIEYMEEQMNALREENNALNDKIVALSAEISKKELEKQEIMKKQKQTHEEASSPCIKENSNPNIQELASAYENVINGLNEELINSNQSKNKLASLVVKQNMIINKIERKIEEYSLNNKEKEDCVIEYLQDNLFNQLNANEIREINRTIDNSQLTKQRKLKQIISIISDSRSSESKTLCKEMLEWVSSYQKATSNKEIIEEISKFCSRNGKGSLKESLEELQNENIASFNALQVISFMHTVCELQEEELRSIKAKSAAYEKELNECRASCDKLAAKVEQGQEKRKRFKEIVEALRNELDSRLKLQNKMQETLDDSKKQLISLSKQLDESNAEAEAVKAENSKLKAAVRASEKQAEEKEEERKDLEMQVELLKKALDESKKSNKAALLTMKKEANKFIKTNETKEKKISELTKLIKNQEKQHKEEIESIRNSSSMENESSSFEAFELQKRLQESEIAYNVLQSKLSEANHHAEELQKDLISTRMEKKTLEGKLRTESSRQVLYNDIPPQTLH